MAAGGVPSRRLIVAVSACCVAATASLAILGTAVFVAGGPRTVIAPFGIDETFFHPYEQLYLIFAIAAALAAAGGLLVIHWARRTGWPWLLLAGTLLTATLLLIEYDPEGVGFLNRETLFAAWGSGPVLTLLGLLGAGSWLLPVVRSTAAAVIGVAVAAPVSGVVLVYLALDNVETVSALRAWHTALVAVGVAGALGATTLVPALRRMPVPGRPAPAVTAVGIAVAALQLAPILVLHLAYDPMSRVLADPLAGYREPSDQWTELLGLSGLTIFAAAIGLAAIMGNKALGAAMTAGLVLYGIGIPFTQILSSVSNPAAGILLTLGGGAIGIAALATPWRNWVAGCSGAVVGIMTLVVFADAGASPDPIATALAYALLPLLVITVVTTIGSVAATLVGYGQIPAAIGAVAVTIQVSLLDANALVQHSMFAGDDPRSTYGLLAAGSGIALILASALVLALGFAREQQPAEPPDQAELRPGVPVAR